MAPRKAESAMVWKFDGARLRAERTKAGYRPAELLAQRMHEEPECGAVIDDQIYKWEKGEARPGLFHAFALQRIFKVKVQDWYRLVPQRQ